VGEDVVDRAWRGALSLNHSLHGVLLATGGEEYVHKIAEEEQAARKAGVKKQPSEGIGLQQVTAGVLTGYEAALFRGLGYYQDANDQTLRPLPQTEEGVSIPFLMREPGSEPEPGTGTVPSQDASPSVGIPRAGFLARGGIVAFSVSRSGKDPVNFLAGLPASVAAHMSRE